MGGFDAAMQAPFIADDEWYFALDELARARSQDGYARGSSSRREVGRDAGSRAFQCQAQLLRRHYSAGMGGRNAMAGLKLMEELLEKQDHFYRCMGRKGFGDNFAESHRIHIDKEAYSISMERVDLSTGSGCGRICIGRFLMSSPRELDVIGRLVELEHVFDDNISRRIDGDVAAARIRGGRISNCEVLGNIINSSGSDGRRRNVVSSHQEQKFGAAPPITTFRSHERSLQGDYYRNGRGRRYHGPVCDKCEEQGASHYHHPLRCHLQHPCWKLPGGTPELNGVRSWYVRGNGKFHMGDVFPVCEKMVCKGE
jgi:hypothetical protein